MNPGPPDNLNFYPYYEQLLREKRKTRTVRLGDQTSKYRKGTMADLTCGWNPTDSMMLGQIRITDVFCVPIKSLKDVDLEGESPDCLSVAAVPFVLSAIYRKIVTQSDLVTVIRWDYVE
jgi:hypothetical protein